MKVYDPAKAHDYYVRTRKLKGRKTGQKVQTSKGSSSTDSSTQIAEQRAYAAKRMNDIKARLAQLSEEVDRMLAEAPVNKRPLRLDKFRDNEDPVIDQ
jgi:hypothetical protein